MSETNLDVAASEVIEYATAYGPARLHRNPATGPDAPLACLVLGHGAGNGIEMHDIASLAAALPAQGISVVRVEQPWRVAGRRIATAPATLDVALRDGVAALGSADRSVPLIVGGRSAGARSAARCAEGLGALGALLLAFPLHPPGKVEPTRRSDLDEAIGAGRRALVVQGERDALGRPDEFADAYDGDLPAALDLVVVPEADHSLTVGKGAALGIDDVRALIVEAALEWIVREAVG